VKTRHIIYVGFLMAGLGGIASHLYYNQSPSPDREIPAPVEDPETLEPGAHRPGFALTDIEGVTRNVDEWDGMVIVLNFWATWCPPCRGEIPEFVHLQEKYAEQGVRFVGIAPEEAGPVRDFASEFHINYPLLIGQGDVIRISEEYGNTIGALPYTVIVDRQGRIAHMQRGPLPGEKAESIIQSLL